MGPNEQTALTPAMFALLLVLNEGPRHGYALMAEVAELTEGAVELGPATLYRSLQRMRVQGLIEELPLESPPGAEVRGDRRAERRRRYQVTAAGRQVSAEEAHRLVKLTRAALRVGVLDTAEENT